MEVKTYTQTLEFLRSYIEPVASTAEKTISEALGFVLAEDLHSPIDLPLFNNSAMDGWAFGSEDIKPEGFTLKEVGSSFAGHPYPKKLQSGECVRIMTGGEVPEGADTVVKQEIVKADDKEITFPSEVRADDNVRRKGEEIRSGDVCMTKGTLLHAPEINFLAALGIHKVTVFKKVKVGFFSTGDELQSIDQHLLRENLRFEPLLHRSDVKRKRL